MVIRDFIKRHYHHFNAGALADCAESLNGFLENDGRLMVTLAGAMSTAGIGRSLAPCNPFAKDSRNLLHRGKFGRRPVSFGRLFKLRKSR